MLVHQRVLLFIFWLNLLHFKNTQNLTTTSLGYRIFGRRRDSTDRTGARNWSRCRPAELGLVKCETQVCLLKQVSEWSEVPKVAIEGIINTEKHYIYIYLFIYIHV